jgi:transposase
MELTMKDRRKIEVIEAVMDERISVEDGGRILDRSRRSIFRMLKRLREQGLKGLIHGNRGKKNPRQIKEKVVERIVSLARGKYAGINDTHLREILERQEGIPVSREKLRQMLRAAHISPKRKRRPPKYRGRRERKDTLGMMLQIDASSHDWLEERGPWLTLVGAIDDATGHVWARFEEAETTWAYFRLMEGVFASAGLPLSLYADRHGIFQINREPTIIEQLNNQRPLTQFGRAMEELGIQVLKAWSPQAKGRIERLWGTLQDRLVVELRLAKVKTREKANQVLKQFLIEFNQRFTVKAKRSESLFKKPPPTIQLDRILCLKENRIVNNDHTISFEGLILQIPPSSRWASIAGQKVQVLQLQDGTIEIVYKLMTVARFRPQAVAQLIGRIQPERTLLKYAA